MSGLPVAWLAEALLASTLLMAAVLVLRHPAARLFGGHASYLLWALPALRMVLPPLPQNSVLDLPAGIDLTRVEVMQSEPVLAQSPVAVATAPFDWVLFVLAVWALGALVHLAWRIVAYQRFIAASGAVTLYRVGGVFVQAADVEGPAAAGILRRRILLPHDFAARFDADEQHLALAHELAHHRRGDLVANWVALVLLSLHWFNPVAHLAYRAFRADQELACDATVLKASSAEKIHAYACAIVKATWDRGVVAACALGHAGQLKRRLQMMKSVKKTLVRSLSGVAITLATVGAGLALTASGRAAEALVETAIEPILAQSPSLAAIEPAPTATPAPTPVPAAPLAEIVAPIVQEVTLAELQPPAAPAPGLPVAPQTPAPVLTEVTAPQTPKTKVMRYRLYDSLEEYVIEANKAVLDGLMQGRSPGGEPVELRSVTIEGLSTDEAKGIQNALNVRNANAALFEGPWSGAATVAIDWARRRSPDARVAPSPQAATASVRRAQIALASALPQPGTARFRAVRAAYAPAAYGVGTQGKPYVGFCGQIDQGPLSGWTPFFVSETPSLVDGKAQQVFVGKAAEARCGGRLSAEDYTAAFQAVARLYQTLAPERRRGA